jgi:hypothetical protein
MYKRIEQTRDVMMMKYNTAVKKMKNQEKKKTKEHVISFIAACPKREIFDWHFVCFFFFLDVKFYVRPLPCQEVNALSLP